MVQVIKTQPVILTVENDQDSIAFAQRVIHARYQMVSDAIQANEALFHVQQELGQAQEDLRLTRWRAKRNGLLLSRAEARAKRYAWAAWILAGVAVTVSLRRSA